MADEPFESPLTSRAFTPDRRARAALLSRIGTATSEDAVNHPRLGLRTNGPQLAILLLSIFFLGTVVGVERSVLPLLASAEFGLGSATVTLGFLVAFGLAKAPANFLAGIFADRIGRRRVVLIGWLFALPVPPLIIAAPDWGWIVAANLLLGINQGLVWSGALIMKIDLAGPLRRGLVAGANEFAGYLAVAGAALAAGYVAASFGPRPAPYLIAAGAAVLGTVLALLGLRDTRSHAALEAPAPQGDSVHGLAHGAARALRASWRNPALMAASQAGFVNNMKEGVAWGLLPLFLASEGLGTKEIGWIVALYPAIWGALQLGAGALSDRWGRRGLIAAGLGLQSLALLGLAWLDSLPGWAASAALLGVGTAAVYPTLIAQAGDAVGPRERAGAIGAYRFWRDCGYVAGGLVAGAVADLFGFRLAISLVAGLVAASAVVARVWLPAPERAHSIASSPTLQSPAQAQ